VFNIGPSAEPKSTLHEITRRLEPRQPQRNRPIPAQPSWLVIFPPRCKDGDKIWFNFRNYVYRPYPFFISAHDDHESCQPCAPSDSPESGRIMSERLDNCRHPLARGRYFPAPRLSVHCSMQVPPTRQHTPPTFHSSTDGRPSCAPFSSILGQRFRQYPVK
jgi:hypothetical protein